MIKGQSKVKRRLLSFALTAMMTIPLLTAINGNSVNTVQAATKTLHNPTRNKDGSVKWDLVYFGKYPQSDASGKTKEPIKWRVLSVNGQDAFLVSDNVLDWQQFYTSFDSITWEKSTVRSWLNGYDGTMNAKHNAYITNSFMNQAFAASEQAAIKTTTVRNADNPYTGVSAGADTSDKIFLLSYDDITNKAYGFDPDRSQDDFDIANTHTYTAYAAKWDRTLTAGDIGRWWLRTPAAMQRNMMYVNKYQIVRGDGKNIGFQVDVRCGICPALHLDLSKTDVWSYAGTVTVGVADKKVKFTTTAGDKPPVVPAASKTETKTDKSTYTNYVVNTKSKTAQYKGTAVKVTDIVVPDTVTLSGTKYKVTSIANDAFVDNTLVKSVKIGNNVTTIGNNAFSGCTNLKTVTGGKNVKTIGNNAFYNCSKLSKITLYKNVKKIGNQAFYGCKKLKTINVKTSKLTKSKVGADAFKGIHAKATFKVPKKKLKSYKSIFKAKGAGSKVKYKKQ